MSLLWSNKNIRASVPRQKRMSRQEPPPSAPPYGASSRCQSSNRYLAYLDPWAPSVCFRLDPKISPQLQPPNAQEASSHDATSAKSLKSPAKGYGSFFSRHMRHNRDITEIHLYSVKKNEWFYMLVRHIIYIHTHMLLWRWYIYIYIRICYCDDEWKYQLNVYYCIKQGTQPMARNSVFPKRALRKHVMVCDVR